MQFRFFDLGSPVIPKESYISLAFVAPAGKSGELSVLQRHHNVKDCRIWGQIRLTGTSEGLQSNPLGCTAVKPEFCGCKWSSSSSWVFPLCVRTVVCIHWAVHLQYLSWGLLFFLLPHSTLCFPSKVFLRKNLWFFMFFICQLLLLA